MQSPSSMNSYRHDDAEIEDQVRYAQDLLDQHDDLLDLDDAFDVDFSDDPIDLSEV